MIKWLLSRYQMYFSHTRTHTHTHTHIHTHTHTCVGLMAGNRISFAHDLGLRHHFTPGIVHVTHSQGRYPLSRLGWRQKFSAACRHVDWCPISHTSAGIASIVSGVEGGDQSSRHVAFCHPTTMKKLSQVVTRTDSDKHTY
jgi:hypothetical protein